MTRLIPSFFCINLLLVQFVFAQDSTVKKPDIDPSKPTNLYTQFNANLEYQSGKTQNLIGLRTNIQYAINPDNLFMIEVPFLYNDKTSKFGIVDPRIRYFNVVKRNIIDQKWFRSGVEPSDWSK